MVEIDNPALIPSPDQIDYIEEPYVTASVLLPGEYLGAAMELCQERRGEYLNTEYLESGRVRLSYSSSPPGGDNL